MSVGPHLCPYVRTRPLFGNPCCFLCQFDRSASKVGKPEWAKSARRGEAGGGPPPLPQDGQLCRGRVSPPPGGSSPDTIWTCRFGAHKEDDDDMTSQLVKVSVYLGPRHAPRVLLRPGMQRLLCCQWDGRVRSRSFIFFNRGSQGSSKKWLVLGPGQGSNKMAWGHLLVLSYPSCLAGWVLRPGASTSHSQGERGGRVPANSGVAVETCPSRTEGPLALSSCIARSPFLVSPGVSRQSAHLYCTWGCPPSGFGVATAQS